MINKFTKYFILMIAFTMLCALGAGAVMQKDYEFQEIKAYQTHISPLIKFKRTLPPLDGTKFASNYNGTPKKAGSEAETTVDSVNQIKRVWSRGDQFYIKLLLSDYQSEISLIAYNMLGKEVLKIHNGTPKPKENDYEFSSAGLPNGVYICVLQGKNFKSVDKFIVSRSR